MIRFKNFKFNFFMKISYFDEKLILSMTEIFYYDLVIKLYKFI